MRLNLYIYKTIARLLPHVQNTELVVITLISEIWIENKGINETLNSNGIYFYKLKLFRQNYMKKLISMTHKKQQGVLIWRNIYDLGKR